MIHILLTKRGFKDCGITNDEFMDENSICLKCNKPTLKIEKNKQTGKSNVLGCTNCGAGYRLKEK